MGFGEVYGALNEDRAKYSKIEKEKLIPRAGIDPNIVLAWEEILIQQKIYWKTFIFKFNYIKRISLEFTYSIWLVNHNRVILDSKPRAYCNKILPEALILCSAEPI